MTQPDLDTDELRRLLAEATAGPWQQLSPSGVYGPPLGDQNSTVELVAATYSSRGGLYEDNAAAIVAAVNYCRDALPALLDKLEAVEKALHDVHWTIERQDVAKALVGAVLHCDLGPSDDPDVMLQLYDLIPEEWCAPDRSTAAEDIAENMAFSVLSAWLAAARAALRPKETSGGL